QIVVHIVLVADTLPVHEQSVVVVVDGAVVSGDHFGHGEAQVVGERIAQVQVSVVGIVSVVVPGTDQNAVFVVAVAQGVVAVLVIGGVATVTVVTHAEVTGERDPGVAEAGNDFGQIGVGIVRVVVVDVGQVVGEVTKGAAVTDIQIVFSGIGFGTAPDTGVKTGRVAVIQATEDLSRAVGNILTTP